MDRIKVIPLQEVNGVKFGMKRTEVRNILGKATEFKKSRFSKTTSDDFGFCHVFYNLNDECEAIEVFDNTEIEFDGIVVFPSDIETVKSLFGEFINEDGSFINYKKSIGIYAPSGKMESMLFGILGYYN